MVKNLPTMQETWFWSLGWEDPVEEGMATHSSILAWRTHGQSLAGYSPWGCRVRLDWALFTFTSGRWKEWILFHLHLTVEKLRPREVSVWWGSWHVAGVKYMFMEWTDESIYWGQAPSTYSLVLPAPRAWHLGSPWSENLNACCGPGAPRSQGLGQGKDTVFPSLRLWQSVRWKQYMQITKPCKTPGD